MKMAKAPATAPLFKALGDYKSILISVGCFTALINVLMLVPSIYMLQVYDRVLSSQNETTLAMLSLMVVGFFAFIGLLEVVRSKHTAKDVMATVMQVAKKIKKVAVVSGVCDGFIGNRMIEQYSRQAGFLLDEGASPQQVDKAIEKFGFAMGPFQVTDLAGGDIGWATRKRRAATRDPKARYVEIADRICERGWFGQKTGRGFYLYPEGARVGQPDPEVLAIVDAERAKKGVTPRQFTADEIMRRYMAAMVNEGAKVVAEGIALRPLDVDVTFVAGYGFPRHRGGPMKWADMTGLPKVLADIQAFAKEDPLFWKPAPLLEQLVAEGRNFDSLNQLA